MKRQTAGLLANPAVFLRMRRVHARTYLLIYDCFRDKILLEKYFQYIKEKKDD